MRPVRFRPPLCLALSALGWVMTAAIVEAAPKAVPLATPLGPSAGPLFVPGQALPVENAYNDPRMWSDLYQEFSVGAVGTGIAIGDFDRDGWPDLYVVSKTEKSRLFRNRGDWKFEDVTAAAGLTDAPAIWKQGATFADVDNDGWLDLYVCRFDAPNLFYRNLGNGTFREEAKTRGLAQVDASGMAAFCDFDRDGDLDVLIQTNLLNVSAEPSGQPNYLLRNDGTGHFTDVTETAGLRGRAQGHSATWWDYDADGWPDLYLANDFEAPDFLYRNLGNGTFENVAAEALPHTPYSAMGSDLGDVNNDGFIDLLVADMAATEHAKDQRGMALSRARATEETVPGSAPGYLRNALFLGTGTRHALEAACLTGLAATDWTWAVRFEDLDNDGWLDLFVTNGMVRELHHGDLLSRMMTAESGAERVRLMRQSPPLTERNLAFRNQGDLRFEATGPAWGLDHAGVSFGAAFGDLDLDGDLDLVFANYQNPPTVLKNQGVTGQRVTIALQGRTSNHFGVGTQVTVRAGGQLQTRTLVLARGYLSSSEPLLHFGLGEATQIDEVTLNWPSGTLERYENLSAGQRYTFVEGEGQAVDKPKASTTLLQEVSREAGFAAVSREEAVDETRSQPLLPRRFHRRGPSLAVGDLNQDGLDDLIQGGTTKDPARIYLSNTSGGLREAGALPPGAVPVNDGPLVLLDINVDGHLDLLQTRSGANFPGGSPAYQPQAWFNDGRGQFSAAPSATTPALSLNTGAVAAADFDHDGDVDLFLGGRVLTGRYPLPPPSALWRNEQGRFVDDTHRWAPSLRQAGLVTAALAADVNGDTWVDLLIAYEWGSVTCWLNEQGRGFREAGDELGFEDAGTGWWTSLASGDLNRDGRPDFVAGNVGLNTPYQASPEEPTLLLAGNFRTGEIKASAAPTLIEAYYENGTLYPRRARRQFAAAVPSINPRFPSTESYSTASLEDLLGSEALDRSMKFQATRLASGVFLSQANGTYRFAPLPRLAQLGPTYGVAIRDIDNDGFLDLLLAQNSFAPLPYVGRFDSSRGLALKGDGRGGFKPISLRESGWLVTGDAKAVVELARGTEAPWWVVSRNAAPSQVFSLSSYSDIGYTLLLRGRPGNPQSIGARVRVTTEGGQVRQHEILACHSYWSQGTVVWSIPLPPKDRPQQVEVLWPEGQVTRHRWPISTRHWQLDSP